ncbi:MAG TPA: hypothetical protein VEF04_04865 [Blastocatellia bacterium]|nr:hypothetical protein [Blastocatellia bacterium]
MKHILSFAAFLFFSLPALAQVSHVGATVNGVFSSSGGNGTSGEVTAQGAYKLIGNDRAKVIGIGQVSIGRDLKSYLGQYGATRRYRISSRVYWRDFYAELGLHSGRVKYTGPDGYAKYTTNPVAGGGYTLPLKNNSSLTASYQHLFTRNISASVPSDGYKARFIDGTQGADRLGAFCVLRLSPANRGVLLFGAETTMARYRRNPERYGAELGRVTHKANSLTVSIGYGFKL